MTSIFQKVTTLYGFVIPYGINVGSVLHRRHILTDSGL